MFTPPHSLAILYPKDTFYSKTISLNQHFLPRILFLSRIILPTPKQIKSLTTLLFKFLWNFSPFEPIKRSTLYLPKSDGGIALPNIGIKTSTAFLWKFIYLLKTPNPHFFFWMSYAIYNIGTKFLHIKPELYSNSQPHRPKPNPLWCKTFSLFTKISTPPQDINNLTFKSLYQTLLQPEPNPIPILDTETSHTWLRPTLVKPRPSLFSNLEKKYPSGQPIMAIPGDFSFPNITSNPETLTIFSVNSAPSLLMILITFYSPVPSPKN